MEQENEPHIEAQSSLENLPSEILLHISKYLPIQDVARMSMVCRRFYQTLPSPILLTPKHMDPLNERGPVGGHFHATHWFDCPPLSGTVKAIDVSMVWRDQGWGNRKGELWIDLVRSGEIILRGNKPRMFPIAPHHDEKVEFVTSNPAYPLLAATTKGDVFRIQYNVGGGGGHQLHIKDFSIKVLI